MALGACVPARGGAAHRAVVIGLDPERQSLPQHSWRHQCSSATTSLSAAWVCGERIVFYLAEGGLVAVLEDFCPHRGAPLSLGTIVEGRLVCGDHGLEMGCDGKTIAMPGQRVRGFPAIRSFPVAERHGFIWVWPSDLAQASEDKIPHLHWARERCRQGAGGRCDDGPA